MTRMKKVLLFTLPAVLLLLMGQGTGPTVFTPRLTVSPGPLTVTTGETTVEDLTINGTCTGCPTTNVPSDLGAVLRSDGAGGITVTGDASIVNDDLTVGGQIISTTGGFVAPNAGVSGAAFGFASDPDLGMSRGGADNLQLQANGGIFFRGIWPTGITIGGTGATQIPTTITGTALFTADPATGSTAIFSGSGGGTDAAIQVSAAQAAINLFESDAAANNKSWDFSVQSEQLQGRVINDANSAVGTWVSVDRTGTTVDTINLQATSVQKNAVEIATYETGSFTVNYGNACTTTPSETWNYIKIGNQVTIKLDAKSGFPCTGDVTSFSSGAVPSNLIPPDNALSPMFGDGGCQDNGTVVQCSMSISGGLGLMAYGDCTGGGACNATGWQAAGNRSGFALGVTFTYSLDP